ncbi:MAG: hypothetical protein ACPG4T_14675 [Nannocystaceae bacterium]
MPAKPTIELVWVEVPTDRQGIYAKTAELGDGATLRIVFDASMIAMLFLEEANDLEALACGQLEDVERQAIEFVEWRLSTKKDGEETPAKDKPAASTAPSEANEIASLKQMVVHQIKRVRE